MDLLQEVIKGGPQDIQGFAVTFAAIATTAKHLYDVFYQHLENNGTPAEAINQKASTDEVFRKQAYIIVRKVLDETREEKVKEWATALTNLYNQTFEINEVEIYCSYLSRLTILDLVVFRLIYKANLGFEQIPLENIISQFDVGEKGFAYSSILHLEGNGLVSRQWNQEIYSQFDTPQNLNFNHIVQCPSGHQFLEFIREDLYK